MSDMINLQTRICFVVAVNDSVTPHSVRLVTRKLSAKLRTGIGVRPKRVNGRTNQSFDFGWKF